MRISTVLCTYNGAQYLGEQLQSILEQTRVPDELVVGDDASRDDTLQLVQQALEAHRAVGGAPIDLVLLTRDPAERAEPYGVAGNFARALAAATGEIVLLSDQDDRWAPDRVERSLAAFAQHPDASLVHGDARLVDGAGAPLGLTLFEALGVTDEELQAIDSGRTFEAMLRRNLVTGATTAVRRELVARALPIPDGWIHDEWLAMVAGATGRTVVLRESLIDYRQHGANQIGARKLDWATRFARLREPRTARNERLLRRARSFVERLDRLEVSGEKRAAAREKLAHEEVRSALPASRIRRLAPVLREWRAGHYTRYGRGAQEALRDLLQPV